MTEDDSPAARFDRYIAEIERDLPERYKHPGRSKPVRPLNPWGSAPAIGLTVVGLGLVLLAIGRWLGYPVGP